MRNTRSNSSSSTVENSCFGEPFFALLGSTSSVLFEGISGSCRRCVNSTSAPSFFFFAERRKQTHTARQNETHSEYMPHQIARESTSSSGTGTHATDERACYAPIRIDDDSLLSSTEGTNALACFLRTSGGRSVALPKNCSDLFTPNAFLLVQLGSSSVRTDFRVFGLSTPRASMLFLVRTGPRSSRCPWRKESDRKLGCGDGSSRSLPSNEEGCSWRTSSERSLSTARAEPLACEVSLGAASGCCSSCSFFSSWLWLCAALSDSCSPGLLCPRLNAEEEERKASSPGAGSASSDVVLHGFWSGSS